MHSHHATLFNMTIAAFSPPSASPAPSRATPQNHATRPVPATPTRSQRAPPHPTYDPARVGADFPPRPMTLQVYASVQQNPPGLAHHTATDLPQRNRIRARSHRIVQRARRRVVQTAPTKCFSWVRRPGQTALRTTAHRVRTPLASAISTRGVRRGFGPHALKRPALPVTSVCVSETMRPACASIVTSPCCQLSNSTSAMGLLSHVANRVQRWLHLHRAGRVTFFAFRTPSSQRARSTSAAASREEPASGFG